MTNHRSATVRVPATSANLGPGFDSLGVALDWAGTYTVTLSDESVPPPPGPIEQMTATAALALLKQAGAPTPAGMTVEYQGDIPVGRGLGVSASARAAGLIAADALIDGGRTLEDLLPLAVQLEGHGDNIVPAMLGGLRVVVEDDHGLVQSGLTPPDDLRLVMLIPEFSMPTEESRKRLPERLTRNQAVHNIGRAALLIAALTQGKYELLGTATEDVLHQPARSALFPAMYPLFQAARDAGAHGVYLSGGGSTIAAFADTAQADVVAGAMREIAAVHGLKVDARICQMSDVGATLVSVE
ncbi:MAG: homoserine kinase [Dehalococcoidia bacterium]|nr:homoserine kinase [Dehalococcoidia bacterium]